MVDGYETPRLLSMGSYLDYLDRYAQRITVTAFIDNHLKTLHLADLPAKLALQWAAHWWRNREVPEVDGVVHQKGP